MTIVFKAIEFAAKAHSGQYRKGTKIPYIVHPLGVGRTLIECGCPDEVVAAGILHDTVEDTHTTLADIEREFGKKVAELVKGASEPDKSDTWENRKEHTIEFLKTAPVEMLMVSCADKLDNITAIRIDYQKLGEKLWSRFNRSKDKQKWYYESLVKVFENRSGKGPEKELFKRFAYEVKKVFPD